MTIRVHQGDLSDLSNYGDSVAIDTETMGLKPHRDRLCVVQLSPGDGSADIVRIARGQNDASVLKSLLTDPAERKALVRDLWRVEIAGGTDLGPVFAAVDTHFGGLGTDDTWKIIDTLARGAIAATRRKASDCCWQTSGRRS